MKEHYPFCLLEWVGLELPAYLFLVYMYVSVVLLPFVFVVKYVNA